MAMSTDYQESLKQSKVGTEESPDQSVAAVPLPALPSLSGDLPTAIDLLDPPSTGTKRKTRKKDNQTAVKDNNSDDKPTTVRLRAPKSYLPAYRSGNHNYYYNKILRSLGFVGSSLRS